MALPSEVWFVVAQILNEEYIDKRVYISPKLVKELFLSVIAEYTEDNEE